jgi:hypothetical protein
MMNKYLSRDNKSRHQRYTSDVFEMATAITNQSSVNCVCLYPNNLQDDTLPLYKEFRETLNGFQNILPTNNEATTAAMAYIMDKYGMGISLSKSNGTKLEAVNAQQNSDGTYSTSTCN